MKNQTCEEFIEELSSKASVPGGGGGSAYVGALGMALGTMVGNLTLGKKKYAAVEEDVKELLNKSEHLTRRLMDLVEADAKAFEPLALAYKMPKETQKEQMLKDEAMQKSLGEAAMVPLEIAKACVEAIKLHAEYAKKGSVMAISDVGCGVAFCKAGLLGARLNVLINLQAMEDASLKQRLKEEIEVVTQEGVMLAGHIYQNVEERIWQ